MPSAMSMSLKLDEVDDLLYFARVNEANDLQQTISELAQEYHSSAENIISLAIDPDSGNSILHFVSANGFSDLLKSLLAQVQNQTESNGEKTPVSPLINKANSQGNTALHWAAYNGHLDVVKILVDAGADMWIKNFAGHLAFFEAERAENNEVVQYLLTASQGNRLAAGHSAEEDATEGEEVELSTSNGAEQNGGVDVVMEEAGPSS